MGENIEQSRNDRGGFLKYTKIKTIGDPDNIDIFSDGEDEIIIEEKIDGANFRFMLKDGKVLFGSHHVTLGNEDEEIGGRWKRAIDFIMEHVKQFGEERSRALGGLIIYGENCVRHSVEYDWEKMPPFIGFDIWNIREGRFYDWDEKYHIFVNHLDIPMVPLIGILKAKEIKNINDDIVPKSEYSSTQAEGVVFKNYSKQIFAKWVTSKFKEVNRSTFGGSKKWANTDEEKLISMYCTNARIDKIIFKMVDEGNKLDMELMKELYKRVVDDIYEENWREILISNWKLDLNMIPKLVAKRCVNVLKFMISQAATYPHIKTEETDTVNEPDG